MLRVPPMYLPPFFHVSLCDQKVTCLCSFSSLTCLLFSFDNNPSESYSIGIALPLRVPPIAYDDRFLRKIRTISCLLVEVLVM